ncbi:MAG: HIT domain-containing protein [Elusimicrobia bacterium]|nr:HIT domain-containing protein [Elusimicrobiota bacterium]
MHEEGNLFAAMFQGHPRERIVRETDNFVVLPTIGQIVEGYLLVLPKAHCLSLGHIPKENYRELEMLKDETVAVLSRVYCRPILFEHGAVSATRKGGACVTHAHLHVVPADVDLLPRIDHRMPRRSLGGLSELKVQVERGIPYLFYETRGGDRFVFDACRLPSQYLRRLLAIEVGAEYKWDWKAHSGLQELTSVLQRLAFWKNARGLASGDSHPEKGLTA